ncbi:MAG: pirin family protein [Pelotomaculaceae bacterium]|jgi:redox-sensitive bicupin YhaK (pirin superfamily)|uniref:Quercetin 2,3-dioxygenase n=1 Tax=anaerobic digester metagenome TaxID=1263854 RepID=A0A485LWE2_9ZZZZ|nr:pirin family protein [Bacillota bacterium]HHU86164.1 pirin family protein [Peptococcaceae bacterium]
MSKIRTIRRILKGQDVIDGAGMKLIRTFANNDVEDFDPFLLLDIFDSVNPEEYVRGLDWHHHRGVETITYLIEGKIAYEDSRENERVLSDGECQWLTAGAGIYHRETPRPVDRLLGVQLWLNLPAKNKMVPFKYRDVSRENIPVIDEGDAKIHIIAGQYKDTPGAFKSDYVKTLFLDVELKADCEWSFDTVKNSKLFVCIVQGEGCFEPKGKDFIPERHVVLFNEGKTLQVKASNKGVRFLILAGKPLKEPVFWGGPIVMNTMEELEQGFDDMDLGKHFLYEVDDDEEKS